MRHSGVLLLLAVLAPAAASAFDEAVRRDEVDAGVHVPVLTRPPELLHFVQAGFPPEAEAAGLTGEVTLKVTLSADGSVDQAEVSVPAGHGFDEAAVAAVRQFRFRPAEVDGQPAPVQIEYLYHFTLAPPPASDAGTPGLEKSATLKGQLIARGSRTRIPGATVRCGDDADSPEAISDDDGQFSLSVQPGKCAVRVIAQGYQLFRTEEVLEPGQTTEVVFHVEPKTAGYQTVVRAQREKKEVVRRTLERQELQKIPGSFGDPVRVLQNFPGVARAPFISGALIVRGASPDQTLTLLDGVEIPILFHLGGGPSVVSSEFLDRIDFFPGGFGAQYGRAVGGVVDVATRKGASDTLHAVVKADFLDTGVFVEAPVTEGVSVAAAARRSYVDALLPLVLPKDPQGGSLLILPRYWDYQLRVDAGATRGKATGTSTSTYSLMAFGSDDLLKLVATGGGRDRDVSIDVHTMFHRLVGTWNRRQGNLGLSVKPFLGYDLARFKFGSSAIRADRFEGGLRSNLSLEVSPRFTFRTGVDTVFNRLVAKAEIPIFAGTQFPAFPGAEPKTEIQTLERQIDSSDLAAYVEADLKVGALTVTPGLRASLAELNRQHRNAIEPRLWLRYALGEDTALKGSIGLYTQPPDPNDMEPQPLGTPELIHEKAFQSSLGVEQRFSPAISIDVTGFYNRRFDNVVSPGRLIANPDGSITRNRFSNDGLGRAYGLEVLLRHDVTRNFFGWLAYTLNRSEARRVGELPYQFTTFDQTHILTAVGSYRLGNNWELGARFRYVTGRPVTPLTHPADLYSSDTNRFAPSSGEFRSTRLAPFHQLDFRVEKSFVYTSWTLTPYLDIQNVYNAKNVEGSFFDYRFREQVDVPGIPFLPVLGVKGSF